MNIKDKMIYAALRYRIARPWEVLDDSMMYAVALPSGEIGYCCVMGNAGEHFALGFYRGQAGLTTYYNMISGSQIRDMKTQFESSCTYECINCDFVNASDGELTKSEKEDIRRVASDNGLKMSRPNGWPSFVKMDNGMDSIGLTDEKDMSDIAEALSAGAALAPAVRIMEDSKLLDFGLDGVYPNPKGGKKIPLLTRGEDGSFKWTTTVMPPAAEPEYSIPEYDDDDAADRIKKIQAEGVYQCKLVHMPTKLGNRDSFVYPLILLMVRAMDGYAMPVTGTYKNGIDEFELLDSLGAMMEKSGFRPKSMVVDDPHTEAFLTDFCEKTGIKLTQTKHLRELDDAWTQIFFMIQRM